MIGVSCKYADAQTCADVCRRYSPFHLIIRPPVYKSLIYKTHTYVSPRLGAHLHLFYVYTHSSKSSGYSFHAM